MREIPFVYNAASLMRTVKGILFDIGDTLLPASALQQTTLVATARDFQQTGRLDDADAFVAAYNGIDADPALDTVDDLNHLYSDARLISGAISAVAPGQDGSLVAPFLAAYRSRLRRAIQPDSETIGTLEELEQSGLRLGIVSNGTTTEQMDQVELLGLSRLLRPILISQAVGVRKPDPTIFLMACNTWRLSADCVLVVGDRPDWEVAGARRAGMRSALTIQFVNHLDRVTPDSQPDYVLTRLSDLRQPELRSWPI